MTRLTTRFIGFFDKEYNAEKFRQLCVSLESLFARITVDDTFGATAVATAHTVDANDSLLLCDTTSGNITVTLPEVSTDMIKNRFSVIIKKQIAANTLTIARSGTDTIDGATSVALTTQYSARHVRAITGGWAIIATV